MQILIKGVSTLSEDGDSVDLYSDDGEMLGTVAWNADFSLEREDVE